MISTSLAALVLAVGPLLSPIEGTDLTARDRELLPSGRHLGYVADVWFSNIVSMQQNGGGIAMHDPGLISAHGRAWSQMRFLLGDLDITDPARPGRPLIDIPHEAWEALRFESLWTATPGFRWRLPAPSPELAARARVAGGRDVGGPTFIPSGLMDREPATVKGAPDDRRALRDAREVFATGSTSGAGNGLWLAFDGLAHDRRYPTLLDPSSGRHIIDEGERLTALSHGILQLGAQPVEVTFVWQQRDRSHEGAEARLPEELTLDADGHAWVAQLGTELRLRPDARLRLALGMGMREDDEEPRTDMPFVVDLEDEWKWMARARGGERLRRSRYDANAELFLGEGPSPLRLSLVGSYATTSSRPRVPGGRVGVTYERGAAMPGDPVGASVLVYDPLREAEEWMNNVRGGVDWSLDVSGVDLELTAAIDYSAIGTPGDRELFFVSPAVGVAATRAWGDTEVFALLRREPELLTAEAAEFLDADRPSGLRYEWNDNGDRVPTADEQGALLARSGGPYHRAASDLRRPASNQAAVGVRTPRFGPFRFVGTWVARFLTDRLTVRLDERTEQSYEPTPFHDPGGDGRGEERAPGGGQDLTVYARQPGTEGEEIYVLENAKRPSFYTGAELQVFAARDTWWFLSLGGAGYWSISGAPFGSFPDRNDPGVIDESSADPNGRVNQWGRPDSDRSFALNLLAGVIPLEGLSCATAVRYRDGQPFVRMVVVDDLPQGPTPIMAVWRGGARHTFHMTMDVRLRYRLQRDDWHATFIVDGFNILGSGTEILEDPRTGEFRAPLEMVPDRAVFATVELGWS